MNTQRLKHIKAKLICHYISVFRVSVTGLIITQMLLVMSLHMISMNHMHPHWILRLRSFFFTSRLYPLIWS